MKINFALTKRHVKRLVNFVDKNNKNGTKYLLKYTDSEQKYDCPVEVSLDDLNEDCITLYQGESDNTVFSLYSDEFEINDYSKIVSGLNVYELNKVKI